jgi:paraquat-inducible protein A
MILWRFTIRSLSIRNKLAFLFSSISFVFLFPGVYLSMLSISSTENIAAKVPHLEYGFFGIPHQVGTEIRHIGINLFDTSRSILKTLEHLWNHGHHFVAIMIFLFSVIVPVTKGLALIYVILHKNRVVREKIFGMIKAIGKWSMCDVFITAIFLVYFSIGAGGTHHLSQVTIMGYILPLNVLIEMQAHLEIGFWCFLTYCLLSLIALQLYENY